jgi:lipopolysaccharide export system permease protein
MRAQKYPLTIDVGKMLENIRSKPDFSDMTFFELLSAIYDLRQKGIAPTSLWLEAHKRVAGSFACFAFLLIGIPLGIKTHRRETSIGVAVSLALVFTYYFFVILAETFKNKPQYYPEVILWAPNLIFELLGLILLWRVSRA